MIIIQNHWFNQSLLGEHSFCHFNDPSPSPSVTLISILSYIPTVILCKHRKNCECCPVSLFIVRSQWLSRIEVFYSLKCQKFLTSSQAMACVCHDLCICICLCSLIRLCLLITLIKCLKVTRLLDRSLKVFTKCICLCLCIFFWWGHVFSSLWSNVSKITSLQNRSLNVFSKYICLCLCLFFGHVMSPHHSN